MNRKTNLLGELSDIKRLSGIIKESLDNNIINVWENSGKADGTYGNYEFHTVTMDEQTLGEYPKYNPGDTLISQKNVLIRVIPGTNSTVNESKINEQMKLIKQVADHHGIDISRYDPAQIEAGLDVESEHGENPQLDVTHDSLLTTLKIVLAHLNEDPHYYTKLKKVEMNEVGFDQHGNPMGFQDSGDSEEDIRQFDRNHAAQPKQDTNQYANIVFMQGQEAEEVIDILNSQGEEAALRHLQQWDNGEYHDISDYPFGKSDKLFKSGDYIMGYNTGIPYVGLSKVLPADTSLGENDDTENLEKVATAMSLAKTLAQENDEVLGKFKDQYGKKQGEKIYYATANKQGRNPETFHMKEGQFRKLSDVFTNLG